MRFRFVTLFAAVLLIGTAVFCIPLSRRVFHPSRQDGVVMIIDAGHGGEDGGAVSADGLKESDVNLAIALRTDLLLGLCGIPVRLTRERDDIAYPDTAISTRQRKRADQEYRAALIRGTDRGVLLSIHQNIYTSPEPRGAQVFYGSVPGSEAFAKEMQEKLAALCGEHRRASPVSEEIYLMRQAACPAILVECGFLSNPEELADLKTDEYRTKLALALTAGCIDHYQELEAHYGKG